MSVNSLSGIGGNQQTQGLQRANDRLQAAIGNLVGAGTDGDVATLSVASQLENSTNGLRQVSANLAQASSLTQVASQGTSQIQDALGQLQTLAAEASSPTLNSSDRTALNEQFQQTVTAIDQLATGTTFNSQPLLDGTIGGGNALSLNSLMDNAGNGNDGQDVTLTIPSLTSSQLFGGNAPNLLTAASAQQAFSAVGNAANQVTGTQANIASFQQAADFASANVESAANNQQAAISDLSDTDFTAASSNASTANIQQNLNIALAAQGNHLTPAVLNLIG